MRNCPKIQNTSDLKRHWLCIYCVPGMLAWWCGRGDSFKLLLAYRRKRHKPMDVGKSVRRVLNESPLSYENDVMINGIQHQLCGQIGLMNEGWQLSWRPEDGKSQGRFQDAFKKRKRPHTWTKATEVLVLIGRRTEDGQRGRQGPDYQTKLLSLQGIMDGLAQTQRLDWRFGSKWDQHSGLYGASFHLWGMFSKTLALQEAGNNVV